jgi:flagellar biosynthetic protein FliO
VAAVVLISGLLAGRSMRGSEGGAASDKAEFEGSPLFAGDPNLWSKGESFGTGELASKTIIAVVLVVGFGAAALYASKKLLPRITGLPGKEIRIVETAHLGPRKAVHLVRIGDQRFLIGSTNERIAMLANLTEPASETDLSAQEVRDFPNINGR